MKIVVHNGLFHADDVISVALARYETEKDIEIVRTRDEKEFVDAELIMDVGGIYDETRFFDHHQSGVPVYENGIKKSACGLYLDSMKSISNDIKMYLLEKALYAVQANDNGQDIKKLGLELPENPFSFVSVFNCNWTKSVYSPEQDERFKAVVDICYDVLVNLVQRGESEKLARQRVAEAIYDPEKHFENVLYIGAYCPWQETVVKYNSNDAVDKIKAVIFSKTNGEYNVQAVPPKADSHDMLAAIPESVMDLEGFVFRHKAGFLAGFDNLESAKKAARRTVKG